MKLCSSDNHYTTVPKLEYLKIISKQYKWSACDQIRKRKRKSGGCVVSSRVEAEAKTITSTEAKAHNENSDDPWFQTAARPLEVPIGNSDMWAVDVFLSQNLSR